MAGPESYIKRISIAVLAVLLLVAAKLESWRSAEHENTASSRDVVCTALYSCFALGTSGFDTRSKGQRPWQIIGGFASYSSENFEGWNTLQ